MSHNVVQAVKRALNCRWGNWTKKESIDFYPYAFVLLYTQVRTGSNSSNLIDHINVKDLIFPFGVGGVDGGFS